MSKNHVLQTNGNGQAADFAFDETIAEHISLGDEDSARREVEQTLSEDFRIRDRFRGRETRIMLYDQGFLRVVEKHKNKTKKHHRLDLRYLDPAPVVSKHFPQRYLKATGIAAGVTLLIALIAWFGLLTAFTIPAAVIGGTVTIMGLIFCLQMSHTRYTFYTLHGRAEALRITAGLGFVGRYEKVLPNIIMAIEDASQDISEDTMVYLRAEMREHYRLRGDGVLSESECSDSTTRILAHFDEPV